MDENLNQRQDMEQSNPVPEHQIQSQWQQQSFYQRPQPQKKKPGFGAGFLTGVGCTLGFAFLAAVMAIALQGLFSVVQNKNLQNQQAEEIQSGEWSYDQYGVLDEDLLTELATILSYIEEAYLYDVDVGQLQDGILKGVVSGLKDPYSEYFNAEELKSFEDSSQGAYVGIGAAVSQELSTGIVRISKPYVGTPSAEAGLLPGDIIEKIDGEEVTGMDLNRVVSLIKGEENTSVVMNIYRESEQREMEVEVVRRKVEIPTVTAEMLENNIGYIVVDSFDGVTADQFKTAYEELKDQGMERVIIDMRDNGGGYVDCVEQMLDYLLPEGTIFYAKGNDGRKYMEYVSDDSAKLDIPCVVLVNENTASAAEIFSGNIQAFGMGQIVGTVTYGKGVMQQLYYTTEDESTAVKLTIADYYIYGDRNVHSVGVIPDVEVELDEEAATQLEIEREDDAQFQQAIEVVMGQ